MVPPAPAEADDDLDATLGLDGRARPAPKRPVARSRTSSGSTPPPVRRWRRSADDEDDIVARVDDDLEDDRPKRRGERPPVFWRARDSLYFEPLVALAILAVLLVSLFAYTQNWPPVYVVESNSMQHGNGDHLGVLNAGDIVLAQKVPQSSIVTYYDALKGNGFSTYGLLGDVLLYQPNGSGSATPIIHRAILYLQYDAADGRYNASSLNGLSCGPTTAADYYAKGTTGGCGTTGLGPGDSLSLFHIRGRTVVVNFTTESLDLGAHSGYLTLGDNNSYPDQIPVNGGFAILSTLVEPAWVIGVARGMIPWFGALKLLLDGNAGKVPTASWEFLGLTIAGVIFAAAGLHVLARRERETRSGSRRRYDDDLDAESVAGPPPRPIRGPTAVRAWSPDAPAPAASRPAPRPAPRAAPRPVAPAGPRPAVPASGEPRKMSYEQRRRAHFVTARERRSSHAKAEESRSSKSDADADEDDDT